MQKAIQTVLSLIAALLFFAGIGIIAYPSVNKIMVDKSITKEVSAFLERENPNPQISVSSQPESIFPTEVLSEGPKEHRALWEAMYAYNEEIHENHQVQTSNSGIFAHAPFTLSDYDLDSEVFGILSIPAIELEMPILLGASDQNMIEGCGVLNQTSIPIGGINTNCVIGGHRGYQGAEYFLHVPDLVPGDEVIITNLWETLTYVVVDKTIIDPYAVDEILIQEGKDMVTLMTCHPYASGGKQRYLIYCERQSGSDSILTE